MILQSLKIASATGHRWAGVFRKLGARFAQQYRNSPDKIRSKVNVYKGYIAKHSLSGGRLTTRVIEPPGFLIGFTDAHSEPPFALPVAPDYIYPGYGRDVYAPGVAVSEELEPLSFDDEINLRSTGSVYGGTALNVGNPWSGNQFNFTVGAVTEDYGFGVSAATANTDNPATTDDYATLYANVALGINFKWIIAQRTAARPLNVWGISWFEGAIDQYMPGFRVAPRSYPTSTNFGSDLPLSVRMPRQIAVPSCARDRGRMVGVFSVSTSPTRTDFEYACGNTGMILSFITLPGDNTYIFSRHGGAANNLLPGGVTVEQWAGAQPWIQTFTTTEPVEWYDPGQSQTVTIDVEVTHKVAFPVAGDYLHANIPLHGHMPNNLGKPVVAMFEDRVEVYFDFRVTRAWVDERGDDIYPELKPVTLQTQTGIGKLSIPYTVNEENQTFDLGSMSSTAPVLDTSGAVDNSYVGLGGHSEDFHRLYRIQWAGNVGGRSVAIASVIKHKRWEEAPQGAIADGDPVIPNLAGAVLRQTAQSGINAGHSVNWRYSYQTPDGQTSSGQQQWQQEGVRIPGDGDAGEWQDAVGVAMIVDGVVTQWDAKALGWCLLREPTEQRVREDDWRWETEVHKWASTVSDTEIVLCAYDFPSLTGSSVCKILKINVLTASVTLLRTDALPSANARPAIHCYQREVVKDGKTTPPCMIYRLGNQVEPGWMEVSKDGGFTWHRIWEGTHSPGLGATYVGSPLWSPENGKVFNDYV